eukprot:175350_1
MFNANCRFHGSAKGCRNGTRCTFSHANPNSVVFCQNIIMYGRCPYGNQCLFRHTSPSTPVSIRGLNIQYRRPIGKFKIPIAHKDLFDEKGKLCNKVVYTESDSRNGCPWFVIRTKNYIIKEKAIYDRMNVEQYTDKCLEPWRAMKCFTSFRTKKLNGLASIATHKSKTKTNFTVNNLYWLDKLKNIQFDSFKPKEHLTFHNVGDLGDNLIERAIKLSEYFKCDELNDVNLYDTLHKIIRIEGDTRLAFQIVAWDENKDKFMKQKGSVVLDMNTIDFVKIFYPNICINDGVTYTQWRLCNDSVCDVALHRLRYGMFTMLDKELMNDATNYENIKNKIMLLLNEYLSSNLSSIICEYSLYIDEWKLVWTEVQKCGWIELVQKCKMLIGYESNTEINIVNDCDKDCNDVTVYIKGWNKTAVCDAIKYISALYIIPFNWCNCGPGCMDYTWVQDWEDAICNV